jgi:kynurenine formamidase
MRFIDLSLPLEDDKAWSPWWARTRLKHQSHRFGQFIVRLLLGVKKQHLATGTGWANDLIKVSTHGTTHVDAPWHYSPTCGGKKARTIDEMPLDWFYGPGVMLDISHLDRTAAATVDDVQAALAKIGHTLQPGEIVLLRTGNDRSWGQRAYYGLGPGISPEATRWLIEQGIRVMGIDAWGWDRPLRVQAAEAKASGRSDIFWAAHYVGAELEYCHMERLANLDQLPPHGFTVCAFPLKVKGGSAGPARVVALLDE